MRKKATVRELRLKTSEIVKLVANGETFVIEKRGTPVAELRPVGRLGSAARMPDREELLMQLPRVKTDSGPSLEQDRA